MLNWLRLACVSLGAPPDSEMHDLRKSTGVGKRLGCCEIGTGCPSIALLWTQQTSVFAVNRSTTCSEFKLGKVGLSVVEFVVMLAFLVVELEMLTAMVLLLVMVALVLAQPLLLLLLLLLLMMIVMLIKVAVSVGQDNTGVGVTG